MKSPSKCHLGVRKRGLVTNACNGQPYYDKFHCACVYHYNSRCHNQGSFHAHKFFSPLLRPRPINIQPKSLSTGSVCKPINIQPKLLSIGSVRKPTNSQPTSLSTGSVCKPTVNQHHLALALYINLQSTKVTQHWLCM